MLKGPKGTVFRRYRASTAALRFQFLYIFTSLFSSSFINYIKSWVIEKFEREKAYSQEGKGKYKSDMVKKELGKGVKLIFIAKCILVFLTNLLFARLIAFLLNHLGNKQVMWNVTEFKDIFYQTITEIIKPSAICISLLNILSKVEK